MQNIRLVTFKSSLRRPDLVYLFPISLLLIMDKNIKMNLQRERAEARQASKAPSNMGSLRSLQSSVNMGDRITYLETAIKKQQDKLSEVVATMNELVAAVNNLSSNK